MSSNSTAALTALSLLFACAAPRAQVEFEGGVTVIYQASSDSAVDGSFTASADLVGTLPAGPGVFTAYLEGATTPESGGVAALVGEANGDAGSAADSDGDGRIQLSEFHYGLEVLGGGLTLGLIDDTVFLDASDVANDEAGQFVGAFFVNNPSIAFPDYTLGAAFQGKVDEQFSYTLLLSRSHGLADDKASYPGLFDNDFDADGDGIEESDKGVFAATEVNWSTDDTIVRVGLWYRSGDNARLDGSGTDDNYGTYTSVDFTLGESSLNLRGGLSNPEVSQTSAFVSVAIARPLGSATLGAGIAHAFLSDDDPVASNDDTTQAEFYLRFDPFEGMHVAPHLQWIRNSGFDASGTAFDEDQLVVGIRIGLLFD